MDSKARSDPKERENYCSTTRVIYHVSIGVDNRAFRERTSNLEDGYTRRTGRLSQPQAESLKMLAPCTGTIAFAPASRVNYRRPMYGHSFISRRVHATNKLRARHGAYVCLRVTMFDFFPST